MMTTRHSYRGKQHAHKQVGAPPQASALSSVGTLRCRRPAGVTRLAVSGAGGLATAAWVTSLPPCATAIGSIWNYSVASKSCAERNQELCM